MVNSNIVIKKITGIQHNLTRILQYNHLSLEEFLESDDVKDIVVHNLFVMLQSVVDIGTHIIADRGMEAPDYLGQIPDVLLKEKIVTAQLQKPLKAMIGLRNIIAHQYGDLDFKIIYHIVHENMDDIKLFLHEVIQYCKL